MTELELLTSINENMIIIKQTVALFFYSWILFQLISWARRIINKWRKGQGLDNE